MFQTALFTADIQIIFPLKIGWEQRPENLLTSIEILPLSIEATSLDGIFQVRWLI